MTANVQVEGTTIIADENKFNDLTNISQYGLVTDKPVYIDNNITLEDKVIEVKDDNLFFNGLFCICLQLVKPFFPLRDGSCKCDSMISSMSLLST